MHYNTERYHNRMRLLRRFLGGKCVECGSAENLHIHHKDAGEKRFTISSEFSKPTEELFAECKKCELLCAGCHIRKHASPHGISRYSHQRCRCDICKEAWNKYHRELKRRRKSIEGDAVVL